MDARKQITAAGRRGAAGARAGFTLVELMFVILIVFMLMGLLLVGFRHARQFARRTAEHAAVASLKQATNQFEQQTAFFPPLVKDYGEPPAANGLPYWTPPGASRNVYRVYNPSVAQDLEYLRGVRAGQAGYPDRFSIYTIPYYLLGVGELPVSASDTTPIDGVEGPGTRTPHRDGSFERAGRTIAPLFDVSKNAKAVVTLDAAAGRVQLQDVHGVAYRYYHWEHGKPTGPQIGKVEGVADLNVPVMVGDASADASLRDAKDAIVAAGPNGVFGDEVDLPPWHPQHLDAQALASRLNISDSSDLARLAAAAKADNIVEVLHGK
jgi:type II secretory pathway pseudopilin PulG